MTALKLIGDSRPISVQSPVSCYYLNTTYAYVSSQNTLVWMFLVRSRPNMSVMCYIPTFCNGVNYFLKEPFLMH